jgi:hypothetical protein
MISQMRDNNTKLVSKRCFLVTLFIGLSINVVITYLLATIQDPNSWSGDDEDITQLSLNEDQAPKYLGDLSPSFSEAYKYTPFSKTTDSILISFIPDFGVDRIEYQYKSTAAPTASQTSTDLNAIPSAVYITRYRFGFPMRGQYWDSVGWTPGGGRAFFDRYSKQIIERAGTHAGFETPKWWPISTENYRMPIRPSWSGFILNTFFYSLICLFVYCSPRFLRIRYRRSNNLCISCGYAIENLDTCPECGLE